jgi:hypothetical protein
MQAFGMNTDIAIFDITVWPENDIAFDFGQAGSA